VTENGAEHSLAQLTLPELSLLYNNFEYIYQF